MNNDLYGGRYTEEEVQRIMGINSRPSMLRKPSEPYFKKGSYEVGPSNAEKRAYVHWLINESNISVQAKMYL